MEARCWWKVFPPEPPSSSLPIESGAATQSRCRMRNCRSTFAIWSFVGATGQFQTAQRRTRGTEHEMHVYFSTKKRLCVTTGIYTFSLFLTYWCLFVYCSFILHCVYEINERVKRTLFGHLFLRWTDNASRLLFHLWKHEHQQRYATRPPNDFCLWRSYWINYELVATWRWPTFVQMTQSELFHMAGAV